MPPNPPTCQAHLRLRAFARTICSSTWNFLFQVSSWLAPPRHSDLRPSVISWERIPVHPLFSRSQGSHFSTQGLLSTSPGTLSLEMSNAGLPGQQGCGETLFSSTKWGLVESAGRKPQSSHVAARDKSPCAKHFFFFFGMITFERENTSWGKRQRGQRENPKQALCHQRRARCGTQTHGCEIMP